MNMNAVIGKVLTILKIPIEENEAEVAVRSLPTIVADEPQMVQLMQNLIANAIKFHGPERPVVRISAVRDAKESTFAVKDNGIGIDTASSDKIFQMFERLPTKSERPGTGIGLAICKKIVERHGGRIWVESEEGKGATFYFTLPMKVESDLVNRVFLRGRDL